MHTYERIPQPDPLPEGFFDIGAHPVRCADDVVDWASRHPTVGWMTWPEVWHLDEHGTFCCYTKGSSLDTLKGWADDPSALRCSREEGLRTTGCPDHWLIVDSRSDGATPVDEGDVEAFVRLRPRLDRARASPSSTSMVFDDECHWWSLHELTTGTPTWAPPLRRGTWPSRGAPRRPGPPTPPGRARRDPTPLSQAPRTITITFPR